MTWAAVALVVAAVLLWPSGRSGPLSRRHARLLSRPHGAGRAAGTGRAPSFGSPRTFPGSVLEPAGDDEAPAVSRWRSVTRGARGSGEARAWVADFAELAAVGLDAGLSSAEAARLACGVGQSGGHPRLRSLTEQLAEVDASGGSVGTCLADLAADDEDLSFLAAAWRLTDEFGVPAAPAARTAAEVLRQRAAADDRRTVLAAGPRASMWLLTLLPLSGPLVALVLGLPVTEVYAGTAAVLASAVGLTLTGAGWLWARALLRRSLRPRGVG